MPQSIMKTSKPLRQQVLDEALPGVRSRMYGLLTSDITSTHRDAVHLVRLRVVVVELHRAALVDDVLRRHRRRPARHGSARTSMPRSERWIVRSTFLRTIVADVACGLGVSA